MKKLTLTAILYLAYLCPCLPQATPREGNNPPPILTSLQSSAPLVIRITNDHYVKSFSNIALHWQLMVNGRTTQKGIIPLLPPVSIQKNSILHIPARLSPNPRDEVFLNIDYKLKKKDSLLAAGDTIAATQLLIKSATETDNAVHPAGELTFNDDNGFFSLSSPFCNIRFNKQTGYLVHYVAGGDSLLDEEGGLSPDLVQMPRLQLFSTSTSTEIAIVSADYALPESFYLLHTRYTVNAHGEMQVSQSLEVDTTLISATNPAPDTSRKDLRLPRFGMHWTLPPDHDSVIYYGAVSPANGVTSLASGASSPAIGTARLLVSSQPSLEGHPGETPVYTGIRSWRSTGSKAHGILITADSSHLDIAAHSIPAKSSTRLDINYPFYNMPFANYHYIYKITPL